MTAAESNWEAATYDILGMIADHPIPATWNGVEYEGTTGGLISSKKLESGGFLADYDLQWVTSLWKRTEEGRNELIERFPSENASLPVEGDQLTIAGTAYRIDRITKDDYGAGIQFDLVNVAKME